jgi:cellulose synthase/poly-beta-1,6-N-acetylglucosamine synthase-like glycosyltransferase
MATPALHTVTGDLLLPLLTAIGWTVQWLLVVPCVYLLVLAVASQLPGRPAAPRGAAGKAAGELPFWVVLVPAHNEAETLPRTLASLAGLDYPQGRWRLVVIADNCDDDTARIARRHGTLQGLPIEVWSRHDEIEKGKGHALQWALQRLIAEGDDRIDGWVVVDADTDVDADLLRAFARGLGQGWEAMQGSYGIRDAASTPRRRLAYLSAGLYHQMRAQGRDRLGWSAGLFGNGMAFDWAIAQELGWQAMSIVEDIEYQAILALHGISVHYVPQARLWAEAPRTLTDSSSQRQRWEHGRSALTRFYVPKLLSAAWQDRDGMPAVLALDIAMPSYTVLGGLVAASGVLALLPGLGAMPWGIAMASLGLYFVLGLHAVRGPSWLLPTLCWAPLYAAWVLLLRCKPAAPRTWVRTPRDGKVGD